MTQAPQSLSCKNCNTYVSEETADANYELLKNFERIVDAEWCSPECYLSFQKPRTQLYNFTELRCAVSNVYGRSVREAPHRSQLKGWGGELSQDVYHGREQGSTPAPRSTAVKRVITRSKH